MGNTFAYAILLAWPLFAVYLFSTKRIQFAVTVTILGGFMVLPAGTVIDPPLFPAMGQHTLPVLSVLLCCWFIKKKRIKFFSGLGKIKYLIILFVTGPIITAALNGDSLVIGGRYLTGLSLYDGLSFVINQFLIIVPFFIGRQFFKTYDEQVKLFKLLVVAGLLYSPLMLFEVRMSPQLHTWFYGYFPHSFIQQYRMGGFRPVVFMGHGLLVAFFAVVVLIATVALMRVREKVYMFSTKMLTYYFSIVLLFCKSLASIIYGFTGLLVLLFTRPNMQTKGAIAFVLITMFYPIMSIMDLFPHKEILEISRDIDVSRAQSLEFRFDNEEILLERGRERFWFGWGGWGRNRVYDAETGEDLSITDGKWILSFGQFGFVGFLAEFGLLALAVFGASRVLKKIREKKERDLMAAHMLLVSLIMIDQIPNASLAPWLWLIVGVLSGRASQIALEQKEMVKRDNYG